MKDFFKHISRHREIYLLVPFSLLLCVATIVLVNLLTGRPVIDDPGTLVGWAYQVFSVIILVMLVCQTQEHLFGFRSEKHKDGTPIPLQDDIFDACISFALLSFFTWLLFLR